MRRALSGAVLVAVLLGLGNLLFAQGTIASKKLPVSFLKQNALPKTGHASDGFVAATTRKGNAGNVVKNAVTSGIPGIDSVINWSDQFTEQGFDGNGNPQSVWPYTMVGNPPESNKSASIDAPIVPVSVDLLGPDGNVAVFNGHQLTFAETPDLVSATVNSPVFQPYVYTSGIGQFNDQAFRAEFKGRYAPIGGAAGNNNPSVGWHNTLNPSVKTPRRMQIPWGFWYFFYDPSTNTPVAAAIDADTFGNLLFPTTVPVTNGTPVGAAELAGDITTHDISTFAFNNVYLYVGTINNCCILGYHTYDFEPGDASNGNRLRLYVLNYSSWISPGLFAFGFEDVTALSHEMSETYNDPFINNATPWWLNIDPVLGGGICQNNLEVGDVVEVLTGNTVYASSIGNRTYHPQNIALFNWFAFQSPSTAHLGAYSFPDETTVPALSPANLLPGCVPGP